MFLKKLFALNLIWMLWVDSEMSQKIAAELVVDEITKSLG